MAETIQATVVAMKRLSSDVMQFDLLPHGQGLSFEPGGHVDVHLPIGDAVQIRSYSHVGLGPNRTLQIAVKRMPESRGGSKYMWSLTPGSTIEVMAARNNFPLSFGAASYRLLAGGIGITPIIGIARALNEARKDFDMLYCVQKAADAAFLDILRAEFGDRFTLHADDQEGLLDCAGFVAGVPQDAELYMCGPLPMMDAVKAAWSGERRATAKLRYETFGSTGASDAEGFSVTVLETGDTIEVPKDQTMLDALLSAGQPVMYDCKRGECGLCKVEVEELDGAIDHRDVFLSQEERRSGRCLCACVSRLSHGYARIRIDCISHGRGS